MPCDPEFEQLISRYRRPLTTAAYHLLGDLDAAQDIVQETLVYACRGFAGLRDREQGRIVVVRHPQAQTVLVAKGIRLEVAPDSEISRLGDKAIRLVQGTVSAQVIHGRGFRILTRKLEIVDEGTRFEVHSDSRTDSVTVTEGRVRVRMGKDEYHVGAGETLTSTGDSLHNETRVQQSGGNNTQSEPHGNPVQNARERGTFL